MKDEKIAVGIDLKKLSKYIQIFLLGFLSIFVIANEIGFISINFGSYILYSGFIIALIVAIAFLSFSIGYSEKENINRMFLIVYPYVFDGIYLVLNIHTVLYDSGTIKELKFGFFYVSVCFVVLTALLIILHLIMKDRKKAVSQ